MKTTYLTTNEAIDPVFIFIFGASLVLLLGITAVMVYFVIRYRRSRSPEPTSTADGNLWLEIVWTVLPTLLVLAMFYYGWAGYLALRNVPEGAMEVNATARMWSWNFAYPGGRSGTKLYVPAGKPIKVNLTSVDVLHGFYIPAFRVKRDIVPGMTNHVWFTATKPGSYDIFCSSYCGTGHSAMITTVEALPEAEFAAWLKEGAAGEGAAHPGLALLEQHGCLGCHSTDGSLKIGPSFKNIWGRKTIVQSGAADRTITVDEAYLKRAIMEPNADVVKGFAPAMPPYQLKQDELNAMIGYLRGDTVAVAPKIDGKTLAQEKGCLACHSLDGSKGVGPTLKGLYGSQVKVTKGGKLLSITADAAFLKESIKEPGATVVEGYQPTMPPYPDLSDAEMNAVLKWLEELK